jgi:hypothetical protein
MFASQSAGQPDARRFDANAKSWLMFHGAAEKEVAL